MSDLLLISAIVIALSALVTDRMIIPAVMIRSRTRRRLESRHLDEADNGAESVFAGIAMWLVERPIISGDFKELEPHLEASGRSPSEARYHYLLSCWLAPLLATVASAFFLSPEVAFLIFLAAFYVPRRGIRAAGTASEKIQNKEAIELCHLTRMLMEAGLTPERCLRVISVQARDVLPLLIKRIDRFNRVMESGADRSQAFDELCRNRNISVLRNYAVLMKQSGSLGSRLSDSLDQIIHEGLHEQRNTLKEETNRVGAKMTVVMMVCMLPSLFILVGGPAAMSVINALGS
ncbi:tight adherence protein C [Marinobacter pelagius]|uniref:Tight adherence protein C n=1 Tax=Marinobacter pelagius TaxID=379482 RepID=A0A366GDN3_9GAMM|nr:type II secretion system F family protein [Marinobacter pelagius]RBP25053.1 tight adherence protein C [Marinobacter pelagius]